MKKDDLLFLFIFKKEHFKNFLRITRISFLFLFVVVLHATAINLDALNVKIEIQSSELSIKQFLTEIEHQTDFLILYRNDDIDVSRVVRIKNKTGNLSSMLSEVFSDTDIRYEFQNKYIVLAKNVSSENKVSFQQQTRTIIGTVTDESGEPLIGASVGIKGTAKGTITDAEGKFSINQVSSDNQLVISYIGYIAQEINIGNQNTFNIRLAEDRQMLDEVIVVGYGTQRKETLSGAVTAIKADEIITTKTENFVSNIQGKVAGLLIRQQTGEPGVFDNMISIRGYGSPLIIIDGVTRSGREAGDAVKELAQLSAEDIESVSILKDAAAAIYGMNAANGAIIVTTKKGTTQGKAKFAYTGLYGIKMPTGMELTMDAYNYMLMANEMQRNDGKGMYAAYDSDLLEKYRTNQPGYQDIDWIDLTMHKSVSQQNHNLSVRGGTDKVQYFASAGFTSDEGLLSSDIMYYKRYNFRSNVTAALTNDLKMNVGFSGRQDKRQSKRDDFWAVYKALVTSERGKNWHTMDNEEHYTLIAPEGKNLMAFIDPDVDGYRRWETLNGQAQVELTYTVPFVKGLTLSALTDYNIRQINESYLSRSYPLYDYFSDLYQATYGTDSYYNQIDLYEKAYLRVMATYNKKIGSHSFNIMGAMEGSNERADRLRGQRLYSDLYTHDILNQGTATTATNLGFREFGRLAAYFGRVNYDYANKYLVELVGRYDGSYRYAPEKRWVFFPSASIGWRLSEETFVKNLLPFLDNLKIRASYGESGRDAGDAFQYIPGYTSNAARGYIFDAGTLTTGMYPPGVVNNSLSWVTARISNIGIDFDLPGGKFGGSFDVFERKNTGILATRITTVPNFFGASFPQENINSDMNVGMEVNLTHQGKVGKDFTYYVTANATYARQKRLHTERAAFTSQWDKWLNGNEDRYTGRSLIFNYDGQYTSLEELETAPLHGGTLGNSKMLPGEFRLTDTNGDGVINNNDRVFDNWAFGDEGYTSGTSNTTGTVNPPLQYGFTFMGTYKSFSLNVLFQGAALYSVNFASNDIWGYGRYPTLHEKYYDRWHTGSIEADPYDPATTWISGKFAPVRPWVNPRPGVTSDNVISLFRPMANYLRLKNVEIGYSLPQSFLKKWNISDVKFFVNTTNIFTITNKELKKIDPEKQEKDYNANLTYPIMKAVNFGLNINF
jgi:TonB-linked SusC/RagA family outer membrane protein